MPDNILFYFVFLSQILLISYYYPKQLLGRIKYVLETYPQSKYPKLYPKSSECYKIRVRDYRIINHIILVIGFILIFAVGRWDYSSSGEIDQLLPFVYWVVQVFPLVFMEFSGFAYFRLMRKADVRTTRQASLHPRRLFDFISPTLVGVAILMNIVCIIVFFYLDKFQFYWGSETFIIAITLVASNTLYAGIILWNLRRKKIDPHQANKDRTRQIGVIIKSLVFMSIGGGLFIMISKGINEFTWDYLEASLMSVYLQFIIFIGIGTLLRKLRLENINFDVYKEDASIVK